MHTNRFRIIEAAKEGRKKVYPILAPLIAIVFVFLPRFLVTIVFAFFPQLLPLLFAGNLSRRMLGTLVVAGAILLVFLWVRLVEKRSFSSIGFWKDQFMNKYMRGAFIGFLFISIPVILLVLTGNVHLQIQQITGTTILGIIGSFLFFLIQGASEEVVVRGWLLPVVSIRSRLWIGIAASSLLFALMHLGNPHITLLSIMNIILFGVFAAFYVLRENSLWGVCAVHSIWNWAQGNVYGFGISGGKVSSVLFKPVINAPDILYGGSFGIEGSVITTILLSVASIVLWRKLWRKSP